MTRLGSWAGGAGALHDPAGILESAREDASFLDGALPVHRSSSAGQHATSLQFAPAGVSIAKDAMALSFMAQGPHDIRPDLLLYVVAKDRTRLPRLFEYGCNYLAAWAARRGLKVTEDVLQVCTVDALAILADRTAPYSVRTRAAELHVRASTLGAVRRCAVSAFTSRYREAVEAYINASLGVGDTRDPLA